MRQEFETGPEQSGMRLDTALTECLKTATRSRVQKLISDGLVRVNGRPEKSNHRVRAGEKIEVEIPEPAPAEILPEKIPLDIAYEDEDVIVVNKPKGMVVHPAAGHSSGTLVNALLFHCGSSLSGINGVLRPGIVHRIDRDTTGLLVACKSDAAHLSLAEQLKNHTVTRRYRAVVSGVLREDEGTVDSPIARDPSDRKKMKCGIPDGRRAVTHYQVLERFRNATYIECRLETGRTHQIRVHMASLGHPLLGDTVYGSGRNPYHLTGQALHAMILGFRHPRTGEYLEFCAPLPEEFEKLLKQLRREK